MIENDQEQYVFDHMTAKGVSPKVVTFFIDFMKWMAKARRLSVSEFKTKTSIIAEKFGVSEPTIRRYIKKLKDMNYIKKIDHYNNKNPKKAYIESSTYELTSYTNKMLQDSVNFANRGRNVFFDHKANTSRLY